jgi:hypothetical protein
MSIHAPLAATPVRPTNSTARRGTGPRGIAATPAVVHAGINDTSRPLPSSVRSLLEHRFGASLSDVRIHDGAIAADSARKTGAQAFTVGNDIVFGAGYFDPHSRDGLDLIAHEVAHSLQQRGPGAATTPQLRALSVARSSALEREADAAAREAVHGGGPRGSAGALLRTKAGGPTLSRRKMEWAKVDGDAVSTDGGEVSQWENETPQFAWFLVPTLRIPKEKGPVLPQYQRAAQADGGSALTTQIAFAGSQVSTALKAWRPGTSGLNRRWLEKVGWNAKDANTKWNESGGKAGSGFPESNPGVAAGTCDIDHIVELQLGGSNTLSNLTPLDSKDNQESGRRIWATVSGIARKLRPKVPGQGNVVIGLVFNDVIQDSVVPPTGCKGPGAADCTCVDVDFCAMQKKKSGVNGALEPYPVFTGVQDATFKVPPGDSEVSLEDDENAYSADLVAGMVLETLNRPPDQHFINGFVECEGHQKRHSKTKVPIKLPEDKAKIKLNVINKDGKRRLKLNGDAHPSIPFHYPYLSDGTLRLSFDDANGLSGTGTLQPSLPLLRNTKLDVELADGHFKGVLAPAQAKNLRLPGGFIVTEPALTVELGPDIRADGSFNFHWGKLITGKMTAEATPNDLKLIGTVNAAIPGLEQAKGEVLYSHGQLSGQLTVAAEQLASLPGAPKGTLVVDFDHNGVRPSGLVEVALPGGGGKLQLTVKSAKNSYGFIATASKTFSIKGLKDVALAVVYDGEHLGGVTTTGVDYKGFDGSVTVKYWDGHWSGGARVDVHVNKVTGWIEVKIDEDGALFGAGHASVPLTKDLTAGLGIEKPKHGPIRVTGDLELPPKILVFLPRFFQRTLFDRSFNIPVWGPLVLEVGPHLGFRASVGPGMILNPKVQAGFNPFEQDSDFEFTAAATFNVPTFVGFDAGMRIGLGVDVGVGAATGGLDFTGSVGLNGDPNSIAFTMHYAKGVYDAKLDATINQEIIATLDISGYVRATALGAEIYEHHWKLLNEEWRTGWKLFIFLPLEYHSDRPFMLPDADQIKVEFPSLSLDDLAGNVKSKLGL